MTTSSLLKWLQDWYKGNCDGDWEHAQNIVITTIDNPGWGVTILLEGTLLEGKPFERIEYEESPDLWYVCRVEENTFIADGGPFSLETILNIFKTWTTS